jgi:predicted TPR repeat methyltransferase
LEFLGAQNPAAALESFRRALRMNPEFAPAHNYLGIALKDLGRLDEAAASYRRALIGDPGYAAAHHNLGETLYRQGKLAEARHCFERAVLADPQLPQAHLNLGNVLADLGEFQGAIGHYRRVIASGWNLPAAYASLGTALAVSGQEPESLACFREAVRLVPRSAEAHYNLARALLQGGDHEQALASVQQAILINASLPQVLDLRAAVYWCLEQRAEAVASARAAAPQRSLLQIYYTLGTNLVMCARPESALTCFEEVLRLDPNQPTALHFVAALRGANPEHPAPRYIESVFDDMAETFNDHLVSTLRYTVPRDLAGLARETATRPPPWDILDLGCGTGLFGVEVAASKRHLVGIDLSAGMLAQARSLRLYDRLTQADLLTALDRESPASFDLVAAADVFIYVGKIDAVVERVKSLLRPGGLFLFSAEDAGQPAIGGLDSTPGYRLSTTGRYLHSIDYLRRLAAEHGFTVRQMKAATLRLENFRAAAGWLLVWEVPDAAGGAQPSPGA